MSAALVALIKVYRATVGSILPDSCRFEPTCSDYAIQSLKRHGAIAGCWLAFKRVIRCNPWVAGGYDPVPEERSRPCFGHERSGRHE